MHEIKGSIPGLAVKAGGNMKQSHGNLVAIALPILVLASVAGAGWYYYYSEVDKNQSLSMEISTQKGILKTDLENLQTRINKLLEDETALQARLLSGQESQGELAASLEKTVADKKVMEARLRQEVKKVILTTAELEAELENRRAEQKSLHNEIITVSGENSQLLDQLEQEQESKRHITSLKSRLELELNDRRVEISQLKNQMTVIQLTSDVLFSPGSARIKPDGQKVLSIIAESLNAYPDRFISVEGHTDNLPIVLNTRYASNWELSAARGLAAVNYFQQNSQVDPRRLKVVGYGQYHPVSSNKSAEGRQRNRRIEIKILPPEIAGEARN
ncbi:putative lipoprotein YiaD [bacterium MnTg03]|nr:putative lipoprotein YiaD [bacterium MnTg03]